MAVVAQPAASLPAVPRDPGRSGEQARPALALVLLGCLAAAPARHRRAHLPAQAQEALPVGASRLAPRLPGALLLRPLRCCSGRCWPDACFAHAFTRRLPEQSSSDLGSAGLDRTSSRALSGN